ncbi:MAG TPA: hypothetical protein VNV87_01420 [Acidimicrobiales bacterium]|jgi:hypothetical protein|nr:hypothetical protein [Acidimicrobiales bacterium]
MGDRVLIILTLAVLIVLAGVAVDAQHPNLSASDGWNGLPLQGIR